MDHDRENLIAILNGLTPKERVSQTQVEAVFSLRDLEGLTPLQKASLSFLPSAVLIEAWKSRKIHDVVLHNQGDYVVPARPNMLYISANHGPLAFTTPSGKAVYNPHSTNRTFVNDLIANTYHVSPNIQINTITDKINNTLYLLASLGIFTAMLSIANSIRGSALFGVVFSAIQFLPTSKTAKKEEKKTPLREWPGNLRYLPALGRKYAAALNLTSPPIRVLKSRIPLANAGILATPTQEIGFSRSLLNILENTEKNAVMAHEFGHIAAKHEKKRGWRIFLANTSTTTAYLHYVAISFSEIGFLPVLAAPLLARVIQNIFIKGFGLDPEKAAHRSVTSPVRSLATSFLILDAAYIEGKPDVMLAWAVSQSVVVSQKAVDSYFSKRKEYQADRIAVELTGDAALADGLDKMSKYNNKITQEFSKSTPQMLLLFIKACTIFDSIFSTHPSDSSRRRRMEKIKKKLPTAQAKIC